VAEEVTQNLNSVALITVVLVTLMLATVGFQSC